MKFNRKVIPTTVEYTAISEENLLAKDGIEIKINNGIVLGVEVPDGKLWKVSVFLHVEEFDV